MTLLQKTRLVCKYFPFERTRRKNTKQLRDVIISFPKKYFSEDIIYNMTNNVDCELNVHDNDDVIALGLDSSEILIPTIVFKYLDCIKK